MTALLLAGCAASTGPAQLYGDVLSLTRQGDTGFSSANEQRLQALADARGHCGSIEKSFFLVALNENKPPFVLGNFPRAEVQFMCLAPTDPRLAEQKA